MLKCGLASGAEHEGNAAEVTEMSGLSGLIYSRVVNTVCTEAQTIGIFSSFSQRGIAALMGNVFEMPTFVLSPCSGAVQIRRRSLQTGVICTAHSVQSSTDHHQPGL